MKQGNREDGPGAASLENDAPVAPEIEENEVDDGASAVSSDITALQAQLSEATDRHLRLAADFDNYRKRVERDRADQLARAQAALVKRLIDVLDDLERFAQHTDGTTPPQALHEGVDLIERKLRQVLEAAGLEAVEAEGARFNPEVMEAVASVPTAEPEEDETVSDVFQRGYRFSGTLVRPARVRVKKHEA